MAAFVAARCALAAEIVPWGRFVAAEGAEPVGEAHEDQPARLGDAQHFAEHAAGIGDVFEDVGGERDINRGVAKREGLRVGADSSDGL